MDHKPAVSARTGRTDFERRTSLEKKPVEKSLLSDRIKKHIEEIEQPKNQANQPQPANMLVNKRVVPSRVKTRYYTKNIRRYFCYVVLVRSTLSYFRASKPNGFLNLKPKNLDEELRKLRKSLIVREKIC